MLFSHVVERSGAGRAMGLSRPVQLWGLSHSVQLMNGDGKELSCLSWYEGLSRRRVRCCGGLRACQAMGFISFCPADERRWKSALMFVLI